jgi:hypothetical protein
MQDFLDDLALRVVVVDEQYASAGKRSHPPSVPTSR